MKEVSFLLMFFLILATLFLTLRAEVTTLNGQHIVFGTLTPVGYIILKFINFKSKLIDLKFSFQ